MSTGSNIINDINIMISKNKLSHAYLIEMTKYDDTLVKNIIKLFLCSDKEKKHGNINCGKCNVCDLVDSNNYPDLKMIESDGQWIKKSQLAELKADFANKSLLGNKKIYVIKYAENLNAAAANSILKFIEEPEDDVFALLITKNRYQVIKTILSRCQVLSVVEDSSVEWDSIYDEELLKRFINPRELFVDYKYLLNYYFADKNATKEVLNNVERCFFLYLENNSSDRKSVLSQIDRNRMISYINIIEEELLNLNFNINFKIWLDNLFSRLVEV